MKAYKTNKACSVERLHGEGAKPPHGELHAKRVNQLVACLSIEQRGKVLHDERVAIHRCERLGIFVVPLSKQESLRSKLEFAHDSRLGIARSDAATYRCDRGFCTRLSKLPSVIRRRDERLGRSRPSPRRIDHAAFSDHDSNR